MFYNMFLNNIQVFLTVDPTMQDNDGTENIPRYGRPNNH